MAAQRKPLFDTKLTTIVQGDVSLQNAAIQRSNFAWQAEQWHEFVQAAMQGLRESRPASAWTSIGSSYVGFPIIYNYRHILELVLKGILLAGNDALTMDGQPEISKKVLFGKHNFLDLWPDIVRVFKVLKIPFDLGLEDFKTKDDLHGLLAELDALDPNSTVTRYPVDKEGNPSMGGKWVRFNVFEFAERLDAMIVVLREFPSCIYEEVQQLMEWRYEEQQEALRTGAYDSY
jgi:hypothetical protein